MLHKHNFEKVAEVIPFEEFKYYKGCAAFLRTLVALRCQQTCRSGGGNPLCEIRKRACSVLGMRTDGGMLKTETS